MMLTDDEIKALAYKAADGEAGKRNFSADMSWVIAFTRAVEAAERERCCRVVAVQRDDDRYDVARRTILAIRAGDNFHNVDDDVLRA